MDKIIIQNRDYIGTDPFDEEWLINLCSLVVGFNENSPEEKLVVFFNGELIPDRIDNYDSSFFFYNAVKDGFPAVDIRYLTAESSYSLKVGSSDLKLVKKREVRGYEGDAYLSSLTESEIEEHGFSSSDDVYYTEHERIEIPLPENETIRKILWTIFNLYDTVDIMVAEYATKKENRIESLEYPETRKILSLIRWGDEFLEPFKLSGVLMLISQPEDIQDFWAFRTDKNPILYAKIEDEDFLKFEELKGKVKYFFKKGFPTSTILFKAEYGMDGEGCLKIFSVKSVKVQQLDREPQMIWPLPKK